MQKNRLMYQIKGTREKMQVKIREKKRKNMKEKMINKEVIQKKKNRNLFKKKLIKR